MQIYVKNLLAESNLIMRRNCKTFRPIREEKQFKVKKFGKLCNKIRLGNEGENQNVLDFRPQAIVRCTFMDNVNLKFKV